MSIVKTASEDKVLKKRHIHLAFLLILTSFLMTISLFTSRTSAGSSSVSDKIKVTYKANHEKAKPQFQSVDVDYTFGATDNKGRLAGIDVNGVGVHTHAYYPGGANESIDGIDSSERWIAWNTKADRSGTYYRGGQVINKDADGIVEDALTLYGVYAGLDKIAGTDLSDVEPVIYINGETNHTTKEEAYAYKKDTDGGLQYKATLDFSKKENLHVLWGRIDNKGDSWGHIKARFDARLEFEGTIPVVFKSTWIIPDERALAKPEYAGYAVVSSINGIHTVNMPAAAFKVVDGVKEATLPVRMIDNKDFAKLPYDEFIKPMELTVGNNELGLMTGVTNFDEIAADTENNGNVIKVGGEVALYMKGIPKLVKVPLFGEIDLGSLKLGGPAQADDQYARLVAEVTLSFDTDGAKSETPESQKIELTKEGKLGEKPADAPIKDRHIFDHWEIEEEVEDQEPVYRMFNWEEDRITKDTVLRAKYSKAGYVYTKYVDEDGVELTDGSELFDRIGADYTTDEKAIDGYDLISVPVNKDGKVIDADTEVVYIYKKSPIIASLVDFPNTGRQKENKQFSMEETFVISGIVTFILGGVALTKRIKYNKHN